MNSAENILFTPFKLGPITLRNRTIRADALVLSGGFVSKTPMYILRGAMPIKIFAYCIAVMYSQMATCILNEENPDPKIKEMLR